MALLSWRFRGSVNVSAIAPGERASRWPGAGLEPRKEAWPHAGDAIHSPSKPVMRPASTAWWQRELRAAALIGPWADVRPAGG